MFKHYRNYYWNSGKPVGVEKYLFTQFHELVYDSYLLNFRRLTPMDQMAWSREILCESSNETKALVRNQEDRVILFEEMTFREGFCIASKLCSMHGLPVATHQMYYTRFQDAFNGVILLDLEGRSVIKKIYETDPETGEFTNLLEEHFEFDSQDQGGKNA